MGNIKKIKIASANCRGLAEKNKRKEIMNIWRKKKTSIICLQDIHIAKEDVNVMKNEWGLQAIIAPYRSNARGVAILFNNTIDLIINRTAVDEKGNYIISDITVDGTRITIMNVYGPNTDDPIFYKNLFDIVDQFGNESLIAVGDWNLVLNPSMDLENYKNINNPKAREVMIETLETYNLIDIWRDSHPDTNQCSFWSPRIYLI